MISDIVILQDDPNQEIMRSVTLSNESWAVLAMCAEAYAETYRAKHSQTIATYVTRGQIGQAEVEADKMNVLLQRLDRIQAKLL